MSGHEGLVQLVHEAHEQGLICYVSAGIEDKHVNDAVIAGVDGIGIGKFILLMNCIHAIVSDFKQM